ncbi:MAG: LamG-like jellyroll fold domain-containing protein [Pseudomonadota bacterium]
MTDTGGKTVLVDGRAELDAALASATGGETFVLAGGDYGALSVSPYTTDLNNRETGLTFVAADRADPPSFSELLVYDMQNVTFDGMLFDYTAEAGAPAEHQAFRVLGGSGITVRNSTFDGDTGVGMADARLDGHGVGHGFWSKGSDDLTFENNELFNFFRATSIQEADGVRVTGNDVHSMGVDGLTFAAVENVLIENNHIHDFDIPEDNVGHLDQIQFWTTKTDSPSRNVTIRDNVLDSGDGHYTQSIFILNEEVSRSGAGREMYYENFLIEDNVIYNAHHHGITVGEIDGLTIRNNTVLENEDGGDNGDVNTPRINVAERSTDVTIVNNIVPDDIVTQPGWTVGNNLIVQRDDPQGENYYGDLFVNALYDGNATVDDLRAIPGGVIEEMGVGAARTIFDVPPEEGFDGYIQAGSLGGLAQNTIRFDLTKFYGTDGQIALDDANVTWFFDDGNSARGASVAHRFDTPGEHVVTAIVRVPGEGDLRFSKVVEVRSAVLAEITPETLQIRDPGREGALAFVREDNELGLEIGKAQVTQALGSRLAGATEVSVSFDYNPNDVTHRVSERVVEVVKGIAVTLAHGSIWVEVTTDAGLSQHRFRDVDLLEEGWRNYTVSFTAETGTLVLFEDGQEVGRTTGIAGTALSDTAHDRVTVGSGGGRHEGVVDNVLVLDAAVTAEEAALLAAEGIDTLVARAAEITSSSDAVAAPVPLSQPTLDRADVMARLAAETDALILDFEMTRLSDMETAIRTETSEVSLYTDVSANTALNLDGGVYEIAQQDLFYNNAAFTLSVDFARDPDGDTDSSQRILEIEKGIALVLVGDRLYASVTTTEATHWISTKTLDFKDANWHNVVLTFSGETGDLNLYVDGDAVASKSGLEGEVQTGNIYHGLILGGKWSASLDGLVDDLVFVDEALGADEVLALADRGERTDLLDPRPIDTYSADDLSLL